MKKLIITLLIAIITCVSLFAVSGLTINDATAIQKYLAGLIELTDRQRRVADVDKTGVVDIFDATAIKYLLVGRGIGYWCD